MVKAPVKKVKSDVRKGDFSVNSKVTQEHGKVQQIQTLAYTCCLLHSHKTMIGASMQFDAMALAEKCLKAANKLADTLEV